MYLTLLFVLSLALAAQANTDESCGKCKETQPEDIQGCCETTCSAYPYWPNCQSDCLKGFSCDGKDPSEYQGCKDKSDDCAKDTCGMRLGWDAGYCPVTCGQCDPSVSYEGCVDMLKSCAQVKRYCRRFDWVQTGCKKSCKKC